MNKELFDFLAIRLDCILPVNVDDDVNPVRRRLKRRRRIHERDLYEMFVRREPCWLEGFSRNREEEFSSVRNERRWISRVTGVIVWRLNGARTTRTIAPLRSVLRVKCTGGTTNAKRKTVGNVSSTIKRKNNCSQDFSTQRKQSFAFSLFFARTRTRTLSRWFSLRNINWKKRREETTGGQKRDRAHRSHYSRSPKDPLF